MVEVAIIIILLLVVILLLGSGLFSKQGFSKEEKFEIHSKLNQIYRLLSSSSQSDLRESIIRMDTLFAKTLQKYYNNKESCGANLKISKELFSKKLYNDLWEYHKLRNQVVHDDIQILKDEASKSYTTFKNAILILMK